MERLLVWLARAAATRRWRFVIVWVALLAVASCTCKPSCELSSCGGCCAAGVCEPGNTAAACGSVGLACVACSAGMVCSNGACLTGSAGGGSGRPLMVA